MGLFASLTREQKISLWLLQAGTFLEYFDLMLYIHMAVLLNDLFFPKYDPYTTSLLAAATFCSTYVMRPVGALIFGWLGDNIGRKSTIIITTIMMSISCIIMANLPTYAQIGITAAWVMTFCRMAQGMSSLGEIMGAEIYIAESIPRPASYPAVAFISISATLGGMLALGLASLILSYYFSWRLAFWIGAGIALIGTAARTRLRETPEFLALKREQMKKNIKAIFPEDEKQKKSIEVGWKKPAGVKTLISYFLVYCGFPVTFYLAYIYFNPILKENFGYSSADIINHNFFLSLILVISGIFWAFLSCIIHPIKIIKARAVLAFVLMLVLPFLIIYISSPFQLFLIQSLILIFQLGGMPADAIFIYHLPTWRRFTYANFLYALTRALMYIITSFGLVYLGEYFGSFGLLFVTLPVTLAYLYGILHFEGLERRMGMFGPNNPFYKTDLLKKAWWHKKSV
jgi:MHS family proline/betaine transporter-like MFS transporter